MDNIEILKSLIKGVNPFTGEVCNENEILRDEKVVQSLTNIMNTLANNELKKDIINTPPLSNTQDESGDLTNDENTDFSQLSNPNITSNVKISLTKFLKKIEDLAPSIPKVKATKIKEYLIEQNMLEIDMCAGKDSKRATSKGGEFGIQNGKMTTTFGKIINIILFNKIGQEFIINLIKTGEFFTVHNSKIKKVKNNTIHFSLKNLKTENLILNNNVALSVFLKNLATALPENMIVPKFNEVRNCLVKRGDLIQTDTTDNKMKFLVTPFGESHGITKQHRISLNNISYDVIVYTPTAQKYILDILKEF